MQAIWRKIKKEFSIALPAIIFFLLAFNLINFTERLMLRPLHALNIASISYFKSTIAGLIAAKIIIIVDAFPFLNRFHRKPLIYNIAWKFFIFAICILLYRVLDAFIKFFYHTGNIELTYRLINLKLYSPFFWAIQLWIWMLFLFYIVANEFCIAVGTQKIKKLLFG